MLSQSPFLYLIGFILYATKIPPSVIASRFCDSAIRFFFVSIITWIFRKSNSFFKFFSEKDDILQLGTLSHNYCFPI